MLADRIPYAFPERYDAAYRAELNHFADVIDDIAAPLTGFAESRAALALAEAAARSVREGRPVHPTAPGASSCRISRLSTPAASAASTPPTLPTNPCCRGDALLTGVLVRPLAPPRVPRRRFGTSPR